MHVKYNVFFESSSYFSVLIELNVGVLFTIVLYGISVIYARNLFSLHLPINIHFGFF